MSMGDLGKVLSGVGKLGPQYLLAITLSTGAALFLPPAWLSRIGLERVVAEHQLWIGVAFLGSLAVLASMVLVTAARRVQRWWFQKRWLRRHHHRLHTLTGEERAILLQFIAPKTRTQWLPITYGVVTELEAEDIIARASAISVGGPYFAFNIQPWAWMYLNAHQELLTVRDDEVEQLQELLAGAEAIVAS